MAQKKQPKKPNRQKQLSGGRRLLDAGRRPVLIGLAPDDYDKIRAAANVERRPLTQFFIYYGLAAAELILASTKK